MDYLVTLWWPSLWNCSVIPDKIDTHTHTNRDIKESQVWRRFTEPLPDNNVFCIYNYNFSDGTSSISYLPSRPVLVLQPSLLKLCHLWDSQQLNPALGPTGPRAGLACLQTWSGATHPQSSIRLYSLNIVPGISAWVNLPTGCVIHFIEKTHSG